MSRSRRSWKTRLSLLPLENRTTPAVTSYSGGVLTINLNHQDEGVTITTNVSPSSGIYLSGNFTFTGAGSGPFAMSTTKIVLNDQGTLPNQTATFAAGPLAITSGIESSGVEVVNLFALIAAGTNNIIIDASRQIQQSNTCTTTTGEIQLTANEKNTSTANNIGLLVSGSLVSTAGNVLLYGRGGTNTGDSNIGVDINGGTVSAAALLSVTGIGGGTGNSSDFNYGLRVQGTVQGGGDGSGTFLEGFGGATGGTSNHGILVRGSTAKVTSTGNYIDVHGHGGDTLFSSSVSVGVYLQNGATVTSGGTNAVKVYGDGGSGSSSPTGDNHHGVLIDNSGGTITCGGGDVYVAGTGGGGSATASQSNYGVYLSTTVSTAPATIAAGGSGKTTVSGYGGVTTGNGNYGVYVKGAYSKVTSSGGDVSVNGYGRGAGASAADYGVFVGAGGTITSGNGADVDVYGQMSSGLVTGSSQYGVIVDASGSIITSGGGAVTVIGNGGGSGGSTDDQGVLVQNFGKITAGGSGSVTVTGTGGQSAARGFGVYVRNDGIITSSGGSVIVGGIATPNTASPSYGVNVFDNGTITAGGSGDVFVAGDANNSLAGGSDYGVYLHHSAGKTATITSPGGLVSITGSTSGDVNNVDVFLGNSSAVSGGASHPVIVTADSLEMSSTATMTSASSSVELRTRTVNRPISLGGVESTSALTLTGAELDRVTASTLRIGRNDGTPSGSITLDGVIAAAGTSTLSLLTGGSVITNSLGIIENSVAIRAGGDILLGTVAQSIGTLAAVSNTGKIEVVDTDELIVGTVDSVAGLTANGAIMLTTPRNITVNAGINSSGGGVKLEANTQANHTSGAYVGIFLANSINAGTGSLTLTAFSGDAATGYQVGIHRPASPSLSAGSNITLSGTSLGTGGAGNFGLDLGTSGIITSTGLASNVALTGVGGPSTGVQNVGIYSLSGTISSGGGNVTLTGTGGGSGATSGDNYGIWLSGTTVTAGGTGSVTVTGQGGSGSKGSIGVYLTSASTLMTSNAGPVTVNGTGSASGSSAFGVFLSQGNISSGGNGNVSVSGTGGGQGASDSTGFGVLVASGGTIAAGGLGSLTVTGIGGSGTDGQNDGIHLQDNGRIQGNGGTVSVTGTGGNGAIIDPSHGIAVISPAVIEALGSGTLTVQGTGGSLSPGVYNTGHVHAAGGNLSILGKAGVGTVSSTLSGIRIEGTGHLLGAAGKEITLTADSINLSAASPVVTGAETVKILPMSSDRQIALGANDDNLKLGLTDAELDLFNAAILQIGSISSGDLMVKADITRPAATQMSLGTRFGIAFESGRINTAGGTLVLQTGMGPVQPLTSGFDAIASTLLFAAGSTLKLGRSDPNLLLDVDGQINLTGANLELGGMGTVHYGDVYTLVSGASRIGEFTGLPENSLIPVDNSRYVRLNYTPTGITLTVMPGISSVIVNGEGFQRSRVTSIALLLDPPMDASLFASQGAVSLTRTSGSPLSLDSSNGLIVSPVSGSTSYLLLTFANASQSGIDSASLSDGYWRAFVPSLSYSSPPNSSHLRRLFGDSDGNGTVDATDFSFFPSFGATANSPFDFDNNGDIDATDLAQFGNRFGVTL